MSDKTKIEWTEATWNPVTGCSRVSAGCANCYAETVAHRFDGSKAYPNGFKVTLRPERLDQPLRWKRGRKIFVNSMSDLFHEDVPFEYIAAVFGVMAAAPQHTFQVLTKRPERMLEFFDWAKATGDRWGEFGGMEGPMRAIWEAVNGEHGAQIPDRFAKDDEAGILVGGEDNWPLPNVWLGVSVENQAAADARISLLQHAPAAVHFLSCEPLLGPVNLERVDYRSADGSFPEQWRDPLNARNRYGVTWMAARSGIDWVIVGGESGPRARPMHPEWARGLRDQCAAARVPFFFKQWGEWQDGSAVGGMGEVVQVSGKMGAPKTEEEARGARIMARVGKRVAGRYLDGAEHNGMPGAAA